MTLVTLLHGQYWYGPYYDGDTSSAVEEQAYAYEREAEVNDENFGLVTTGTTSADTYASTARWANYTKTNGSEITSAMFGVRSNRSSYTGGIKGNYDVMLVVRTANSTTSDNVTINHPRMVVGLVVNGEWRAISSYSIVSGSSNATGIVRDRGTRSYSVKDHADSNKQKTIYEYGDLYRKIILRIGHQMDDLSIVVVLGTPFVVSYSANGGTGTMSDKTCYYGTHPYRSFPPDPCGFSKQGYRFTGWNTKADGSGTAVSASAEDLSSIYTKTTAKRSAATETVSTGQYTSENHYYTITTPTLAHVTLYAQWEAIPASSIAMTSNLTGVTPATIESEPTRTEGGVPLYADDENVTIHPLGADGYTLDSIVCYDDTSGVSIFSRTSINNNLSPFTIAWPVRAGRNITLMFNYTPIEYTVAAQVDLPSEGKVSVSVSVNGSPPGQGAASVSATAHWDDTVTYVASGIANGYSFAGWYDSGGNRKSDQTSYDYTVRGGFMLYAKCKVSCSMDVSYNQQTAGDTTTCSIMKDGEAYVLGDSFPVVLGESFGYTLTLGARTEQESWSLDYWTNGADSTPLAYGSSGSVTPTAALALVAHVDSRANTNKTLTVKTGKFLTEPSFELVVPYANNGEAVNPYTFEGNILSSVANQGPGLMGTGVSTGKFAHTFEGGVQYVRLTALTQVWYADGNGGYSKQAFRGFYDPDSENLITRENSCYLLMAENRTVWAMYGAAEPVDVYVRYVDDESAKHGSIAIVALTDPSESAVIDSDGTHATIMQGYKAKFRATPKNSFEFLGWFDRPISAGDPLSADTTYEYLVEASKTIYAAFGPSRDRIWAWEGSTENKTMEWTSKVYAMPRPFDPVAARVDAAGYPLDLTVRTYSSPDKVDPLPVRDHELTRANPLAVQSQDGRRLPRMRPERYVQFSVVTTNEVDAVAIGTNMAEVN